MTKHRDGSLEKSARLITLMEMQNKGLLENLSLQQIANLFPNKPHRSTIMRDLRDVEQLRKTLAAKPGPNAFGVCPHGVNLGNQACSACEPEKIGR